MKLEVERISTKDLHNASDRISHTKNKVHWQFRQMYQKEVFEDMQNNDTIWKHSLYSSSSGLGKSRFAKIWQERISINGKSINSIYTVTAKDGKT